MIARARGNNVELAFFHPLAVLFLDLQIIFNFYLFVLSIICPLFNEETAVQLQQPILNR